MSRLSVLAKRFAPIIAVPMNHFRIGLADWWLANIHPEYGDDILTRLPSLQGDLPAGEGPVVYCGADGNYFNRFAPLFVASLAAASATALLHVHIIGLPDAKVRETSRTVAKLIGSGRYSMSFEDCDLSGFKAHRQILYFQNVRFARLLEIAERTGLAFLATDIDVLFLGPLGKVIRYCDGADLALKLRLDEYDEGRRIRAAVVYLGDTPRARAYLTRAVTRMMLHVFHGPEEEYVDQRSLYKALKTSPTVVLAKFPDEVLSTDSETAIVLTSKGLEKFSEAPRVFASVLANR